jgi:ribonucleotide reductase alpha subunit
MPTASTSQILGYNEAIEPFTSNIYSRSTLAGNFVIVNRYLLDLLKRIGLWSNELKEHIIINNGSVMELTQIPDYIRNVYKTAWDLSMKSVIDQAADRGAYVCQSQSLNLWLANADMSKLSSMHVYGWRKGLKTGIYYLRTRAAARAQQFTIDPSKIRKPKEDSEETPKVESKTDGEGCLMCSG